MEAFQKKKNTTQQNAAILSVRRRGQDVRLYWDGQTDRPVRRYDVYCNGALLQSVSGRKQCCKIQTDGRYAVKAVLKNGEVHTLPEALELNASEGYYFGNIRYYQNRQLTKRLTPGCVEIAVDVGNISSVPFFAVLVGMVYQGGRLIGCESISESVDYGAKELRLSMEMESPDNMLLHVFLWNGMDFENPLLETSVIA